MSAPSPPMSAGCWAGRRCRASATPSPSPPRSAGCRAECRSSAGCQAGCSGRAAAHPPGGLAWEIYLRHPPPLQHIGLQCMRDHRCLGARGLFSDDVFWLTSGRGRVVRVCVLWALMPWCVSSERILRSSDCASDKDTVSGHLLKYMY